MAPLYRRSLLVAAAATLSLPGCAQEDDTGTERLDFFGTSVERNESVSQNLDFLVGDEVTIELDLLDEGTATVELIHSNKTLLDETVTSPSGESFDLDIQQRDDEFHRLRISTDGTAAAVEVTVVR